MALPVYTDAELISLLRAVCLLLELLPVVLPVVLPPLVLPVIRPVLSIRPSSSNSSSPVYNTIQYNTIQIQIAIDFSIPVFEYIFIVLSGEFGCH